MANSKSIKKPKGKRTPSGQITLVEAVKKTEAAPKAKKPRAKSLKDGRVLNQVIFKFADGREQTVKMSEALIKRLKLDVVDLGHVSVKGHQVSGGERHQTRTAFITMGRKATKKGGLRQHWEGVQVPKSATFSDVMYWIMLSQYFKAKPGAVKFGRQETTVDQKVRRATIK
jgi:hypothetical protein